MQLDTSQLSDEEEWEEHILHILDVLDVPFSERAVVEEDSRNPRDRSHASREPASRPSAKRARQSEATADSGRRSSNRPPLPKDARGNTILPARLGNSVIQSLGRIVWDRPRYHTERYLFPVGYESTREALSVKHPNTKTTWTSRISDGGDTPLFEVFAADDPDTIYSGTSSSGAWQPAVKAMNDPARVTNVVSGPDMFGLSNRSVTKTLQELPNADKCANYVRLEDE